MRPVGPRIISAAGVTDSPVVLDWYNKGQGQAACVVLVRNVSGSLAYVVEFMLTNPFNDLSPVWIEVTGTTIPAGVGKYFTVPSVATAVRVRSTTGTGVISYGVLMQGAP